MILKRIYIISLGILLCYVHKTQAQNLSLEQCIEIALRENPLIQLAEIDHKSTKLAKRQAQYSRLPNVESTIGHSWSQGRTIDPTTNQFIDETIAYTNASVAAGMYVFDGFRIFYDTKQKALAEKASHIAYEAQKDALILDVIETYIRVLTAQDLVTRAQGTLDLSESQFELSQNLHKEGAIEPADYYDLKGDIQERKNNLLLAEQALHQAKLKLAHLLHKNLNDLGELQALLIQEELVNYNTEELLSAAKSRPEFAVWDWRIKEAKQEFRKAQAAYYPSLYLSAGMNTNYSNANPLSFWDQTDNNLGKYVALNLSIPIFQGLQVRNRVKQARYEMEKVSGQKAVEENNLRQVVSNAVFDLQSTREAVVNLQEQELSYKESFRIAQVKFELGATQSLHYLTAKNKWENSKNQLLIKQYEALLQQLINSYYLGELNY